MCADPPLEIVEFSDVHRDADGRWRATHESGRVIDAETLDRLQRRAISVRIVEALKKAGCGS